MSSAITLLLITGTAIIVALASVALFMWKKVWAKQAEHDELVKQLEGKQEASRAYLIESTIVICGTVLKDEMNISEAAIRLKVLTDNMDYPDAQRERFKAIEALYQDVSNLDTHQARKDLSKKERMKQDLKRTKAENRHQEAFMEAVSQLLEITRDMQVTRH